MEWARLSSHAGPRLPPGPDKRADVLMKHLHQCLVSVRQGWQPPPASRPVQRIRGQVRQLNTPIVLRSNEMDSVDNVLNLKRVTLATMAAAGLAVSVGSAPALAGSAYGCLYPYVCLKDGTYSGGTNRADSVINTRNDASVWLVDSYPSPDRYLCVRANEHLNLGDYAHPTNGGTWANDVDTIYINNDRGTCSSRQGSAPGRT